VAIFNHLFGVMTWLVPAIRTATPSRQAEDGYLPRDAAGSLWAAMNVGDVIAISSERRSI